MESQITGHWIIFISLVRLTTEKISMLYIIDLLLRETSGNRCIPSQRASKAESVSLPWRYYVCGFQE